MIDTIVLYINNLDKYPTIYEKFYAPAMAKNSFTTAYVDTSTGELIESSKTLVNIYHDNNRVLPLTHRTSISLPSSHYSVATFVNTSRNRLEFNFSIPKYLYGTNVHQFINLYDQSSYYQFNELVKFLRRFIKDNFIQEPVDEDIEINRIDLCYNQYFANKSDALLYLDKQKELLVKFARSSKNKYRTYDTSLFYVTRRYSFKIYHKGTEFEKHDFKQIDKLGNRQGYDLAFLQQQADCILRYEMTFRSSYMNYLLQQLFYASKKMVDMPEYNDHPVKLFYTRWNLFYGQSSFNRRQKTQLEKFVTRSKQFTVRSTFDHTGDPALLINTDTVTFDRQLFGLLYSAFWAKVKEYQLETCFSFHGVLQKIREFNKDNERKNKLRIEKRGGLSESRLIIPALLSQYMALDNLKQYMDRTTYWRLQNDFKKLGMSANTTNIIIPKPKLDYSDYKIFMARYIHREV